MGRKFKDMKSPEQEYAQQVAARPHRPVAEPSHREWRSMDAHEQAAYLARSDGREAEARGHEDARARALNPPKKKRGWFR